MPQYMGFEVTLPNTDSYTGGVQKIMVLLVDKHVASPRRSGTYSIGKLQPFFPERKLALGYPRMKLTRPNQRLELKFHCEDKDVETILNVQYALHPRHKWKMVKIPAPPKSG